jgi:hypothetical protein
MGLFNDRVLFGIRDVTIPLDGTSRSAAISIGTNEADVRFRLSGGCDDYTPSERRRTSWTISAP